MAKYLVLASGEVVEAAGIASSAGVADAGKIPQLDASGRLDTTMMPAGIGADTKAVLSSEALAAGNVVNVYDNAGVANVRKADASNGREASGFVLSAYGSGVMATVYKEGAITGLSGLTTGPVYLSASTAGAVTAAAPSAAGNISQRVGTAYGATEVDFEPQRKVTLA